MKSHETGITSFRSTESLAYAALLHVIFFAQLSYILYIIRCQTVLSAVSVCNFRVAVDKMSVRDIWFLIWYPSSEEILLWIKNRCNFCFQFYIFDSVYVYGVRYSLSCFHYLLVDNAQLLSLPVVRRRVVGIPQSKCQYGNGSWSLFRKIFSPVSFSEGWEQLGLYDYYKEKSQSVKRLEKDVSEGVREPLRSPSPVVIEPPPEEEEKPSDQPARRYRYYIASTVLFRKSV